MIYSNMPVREYYEEDTMSLLKDTSEKAFIKQVLVNYAATAQIELFDDCVVIDPAEIFQISGLPYIVYSLDHPSKIKRPLPKGMEWRFYGRWIAGCTCGDVLAMGAQPRGFSLDLAVPLETSVCVIEDIYAGIQDVTSHYGAKIEGGNLDVNNKLEVVGFCWGTVNRGAIIRRGGARVGDIVAVTSELGIGWASYLLTQFGYFHNLDDDLRMQLKTYNILPVAPHRAILEVVSRLSGAITSGMDLTDGPIEFFYTIRERTGHGVRVYEELIPIPKVLQRAANLLGIHPRLLALDPGYDTPRSHGYTISPDSWEKVRDIFAKHGTPIYRLGEVIDSDKVIWIPEKGRPRILTKFLDDQFDKKNIISRWQEAVKALR